jgi:hypothetical protein
MALEITSKVIGQLKQDDQFPDWWKSDAIEIPFFDNEKLTVTFMNCEPEVDEDFIEEADQALSNFLKLTTADRRSLSELAYQNCLEALDAAGVDESDEPWGELKDRGEIWNFVHPSEIFVSRRPYKEEDIYVMLDCECDWEEEHGLQLVFRQGKKLTRISSQDGHLTEADADDKPDEEDKLLSQF